ncbi:hypothetical protein CDL12_12833 [Handroanthus impetiginosus]|uniref:Ninja-family protein n=1 Tax=Handroanthus impetiginosus TaxID=429701 RepID=A0A2G9HAI3_9LAMI|nr:hypothetical protein CDL12_12833 [Handroanthus impetiginosus]
MEGEKSNFSLRMNGLSRDLLQKFMAKSSYPNENEQEEEDEEIELSLGLSMNGRFGVDPAKKKLKRSSSISNLVFTVGAADNGVTQQACGVEFERYEPLVRTRSLPTAAEEEWRRRKELQSMRRMEARKKRMEKLKNVRVVKDKENSSEDVNNGNEGVNGQRLDNGTSSQGSIGPEKSGSSGTSDHQSEGTKQNNEDSPSPLRYPQGQVNTEPAIRPAVRDINGANGANESLKNAMLDMPYVTTKGEGLNGHKVEGFLYRYRKGEEVRIVCVCHGMFLTPAEFVKHGGGGDVEHPLKHIVVNPFPLL